MSRVQYMPERFSLGYFFSKPLRRARDPVRLAVRTRALPEHRECPSSLKPAACKPQSRAKPAPASEAGVTNQEPKRYTDDPAVTERGKWHFEFFNEFDALQHPQYPNLRQNTANYKLNYRDAETGFDFFG
jgi:hypothetical protein